MLSEALYVSSVSERAVGTPSAKLSKVIAAINTKKTGEKYLFKAVLNISDVLAINNEFYFRTLSTPWSPGKLWLVTDTPNLKGVGPFEGSPSSGSGTTSSYYVVHKDNSRSFLGK
jgi:hypothetical protein